MEFYPGISTKIRSLTGLDFISDLLCMCALMPVSYIIVVYYDRFD